MTLPDSNIVVAPATEHPAAGPGDTTVVPAAGTATGAAAGPARGLGPPPVGLLFSAFS